MVSDRWCSPTGFCLRIGGPENGCLPPISWRRQLKNRYNPAAYRYSLHAAENGRSPVHELIVVQVHQRQRNFRRVEFDPRLVQALVRRLIDCVLWEKRYYSIPVPQPIININTSKYYRIILFLMFVYFSQEKQKIRETIYTSRTSTESQKSGTLTGSFLQENVQHMKADKNNQTGKQGNLAQKVMLEKKKKRNS